MGRKSRAAAAAAAAAARARAERDAPAAKRRKTNVAPADRAEAKARRVIDEHNRPEAPQPTPCRLKLGLRSSRDRNPEALTWQCSCGKLNLPRRCLLADIPVLQCECGREANIDFDFSMGDVTINDEKPIVNTNIKTQGQRDCLLCATVSNMEITLHLRSILAGEEVCECPEIDLHDLHMKYDQVRNRYKFNVVNKWNSDTILILASIAKHQGVVSDEGPESTLHKLPEYMKVKNNFYDIVRVLADGYPLTTGIITGKKFQQLKPGHIYKAPREDKFVPGKCRIGHAILLVGAGRIKGMNYYHFINSWGKTFCLQEDGNRYGFGMVRASDIRIQPIKFIRYQEDIEYHKELASTDLFVGKLEESHPPTAYHLDAEEKTQSSACAQELEGQPVEMAMSIIATFPSEIQAEVPSASPNTLLVTEANMLRERFAHRYHSGSLFGVNSRNRRGEPSCCGDIIGSGLDRNTGHPSRQKASKLIETEGTPFVDKDALKALIRVLRVVQPIYKGQLQRLLLNLCALWESRKSLVQILLDMLMLDLQGSSKKSIEATDPSFRLYGCHANTSACSLLAHDGLSDDAYLLVAEVLKKLVALAPFICCHFINELARSMRNLTVCAMKELHLHEDCGNAILSASLANGMPVLRGLQALRSLVTSIQAEVAVCELIPGGRNIRVTEENKHEYVDRVAEHRLTTAIRPQINAFIEGFHELIPRELISIFNDKEFELLISGLPDIDLDYLKANTEYSGYDIASPVIQWFWEAVQGFSKEDKAQFPQFVASASKASLECFSALQGISGPLWLKIHKAHGSTNYLPSAHICFNNLALPEYTSKDQLQEKLLLAINEANERSGIG